MDTYTYNKMLKFRNSKNSSDVSFFGTIILDEKDLNTNEVIENAYDVYISLEKGEQVPIYKFYNKNGELVALNKNDGKGTLPTSKFVDILSKENMKKLDDFSYAAYKYLDKMDKEIEQTSSCLGISKEALLAMENVDVNQSIDMQNKNKDEKIHLKDKKEESQINNSEKKSAENSKTLQALEKQQTKLSQRVNDYCTLGQILNLPEDSTLVAVYSDDVENSTSQNHTKFSFLVRDKDGNYSEIPNIEQVGGIHPNTNVAESNENGDNVKLTHVNSLYRIKGANNIEYMLTANIGAQGTIELGIGQRDKTQGINSAELATITTPLKTSSTYYTTRDTKEALNGTREGMWQAKERTKEGQAHIGKNCKTTKEEFDGEIGGHTHDDDDIVLQDFSEQELYDMALTILDKSDTIGDVYNRYDVINNLKEASQEHPELSKDELSEIVKTKMENDAAGEKEFGHSPQSLNR